MEKNYLRNLRKIVGNVPLVVAGVSTIMINEDGKILLILRKDNGLWGLPAGSIEIMESPQSAAIREVKEETGLNVNLSDLKLVNVFGGQDFFYTYPNGDKCSYVVNLFVCTIFSGSIVRTTNETKECKFFNSEELPTNIADHELRMLQDYFDHGK